MPAARSLIFACTHAEYLELGRAEQTRPSSVSVTRTHPSAGGLTGIRPRYSSGFVSPNRLLLAGLWTHWLLNHDL